jgi:hypothetical protein
VYAHCVLHLTVHHSSPMIFLGVFPSPINVVQWCMHARHCWFGADLGTFVVLCLAALSLCCPHLTFLKAPGEDKEGVLLLNLRHYQQLLIMLVHACSALVLAGKWDLSAVRQDLITGIGTKSPFFHVQSNLMPFNSPIVDSMTELDQKFSTQHVVANAHCVHSPNSEQLTSSLSEPDTSEPTSLRPKLSNALSHLTFSPKCLCSPALLLHSLSPAQAHGPTCRGTSIFT